jgi:hypothetical protein
MLDVGQLNVVPIPGMEKKESVDLAVQLDVEGVDGVMNGETAPALCSSSFLVPLDAVMFGVANTGEATTISADANANATSMLPLRPFM